jgi:hypothetical protein
MHGVLVCRVSNVTENETCACCTISFPASPSTSDAPSMHSRGLPTRLHGRLPAVLQLHNTHKVRGQHRSCWLRSDQNMCAGCGAVSLSASSSPS